MDITQLREQLCSQGQVEIDDAPLQELINNPAEKETPNGWRSLITAEEARSYLSSIEPGDGATRATRLTNLRDMAEARIGLSCLDSADALVSREASEFIFKGHAPLTPRLQELGFGITAFAEHQLSPEMQSYAHVPALEMPFLGTTGSPYTYFASDGSAPGLFTRLDWIEDENTLYVETNQGEELKVHLDLQQGLVTYQNLAPQLQDPIQTAYLPDPGMEDVISVLPLETDIDQFARFGYNPRKRKLTILSADGQSQTKKLHVPDWMQIQVVNDHFLIAYDRDGDLLGEHHGGFAGFGVTQAGRSYDPRGVVIFQSPESQEDQVSSYLGGYPHSQSWTIQQTLDSLSLEKQSDLDGLTQQRVRIGGTDYNPYGPTEEGHYIFTSATGQSRLLYDPRSGLFTPAHRWAEPGQTAEVTYHEYDIRSGRFTILLTDVTSHEGEIYNIQLNPGEGTYLARRDEQPVYVSTHTPKEDLEISCGDDVIYSDSTIQDHLQASASDTCQVQIDNETLLSVNGDSCQIVDSGPVGLPGVTFYNVNLLQCGGEAYTQVVNVSGVLDARSGEVGVPIPVRPLSFLLFDQSEYRRIRGATYNPGRGDISIKGR